MYPVQNVLKGIVHLKNKILSSFTHPQAAPNLYEFLCSAEHKGRYFEESLLPGCLGAPLTSIVEKKYYGSQWCPRTALFPTFFRISWMHEWMLECMNEWCIYIALYCVLLYTQSALQSCGGGGGLSSTTTSVQHPLGWCDGCHRTTAHHTPATGGEERGKSQVTLCSAEQRHSYRFGTTWRWVNDDRIFIFGWTIPLTTPED